MNRRPDDFKTAFARLGVAAVALSRVTLALAFAPCALMAASTPAFAQPADAINKVTQLNRDALAAIDKREFEKARELLKHALDVCDSAGLDRHPLAARTHVHMGVVIIEGFKNQELGRKQFAKALEIEPTITVTKSLSTPELEEAFSEAKTAATGGAGAAGATPTSDEGSPRPATPPVDVRPAHAAVSSNGLSYHTLSEVKQGSNIVVTVTVEDTLKFRKLVLAYRPQGTTDFLGREMEAVGNGTYSAEIPDRATTGSSVAYYIEAQDDDGQPIAQRGSEERPLVVSFTTTARPTSSRASAVADKQEVRRKSEDDEVEGEGKFFVSLLVGSGLGYVSGMGEVNADTPVSGTVSGALLGHVAPEVGYWVRPDLLASVQGRYQIVTGTTEIDANGRTYSPIHAALALFAKATWFSGSGDFRPFLSAALGGGQIRHVVTFANLRDCGPTHNQTCVDSVAAGPVLGAVGGGMMYKLSTQAALVLSTNLEVAAPDFTINLDVNGGVAFNF